MLYIKCKQNEYMQRCRWVLSVHTKVFKHCKKQSAHLIIKMLLAKKYCSTLPIKWWWGRDQETPYILLTVLASSGVKLPKSIKFLNTMSTAVTSIIWSKPLVNNPTVLACRGISYAHVPPITLAHARTIYLCLRSVVLHRVKSPEHASEPLCFILYNSPLFCILSRAPCVPSKSFLPNIRNMVELTVPSYAYLLVPLKQSYIYGASAIPTTCICCIIIMHRILWWFFGVCIIYTNKSMYRWIPPHQ